MEKKTTKKRNTKCYSTAAPCCVMQGFIVRPLPKEITAGQDTLLSQEKSKVHIHITQEMRPTLSSNTCTQATPLKTTHGLSVGLVEHRQQGGALFFATRKQEGFHVDQWSGGHHYRDAT